MKKTNKKGIEKSEKEELRDIFSIEKQEDIKEVKIVKDKGQEQFAVKIPRNFARELNIDSKNDFFKFSLSVSNNRKILHGELIQNEKKEKGN